MIFCSLNLSYFHKLALFRFSGYNTCKNTTTMSMTFRELYYYPAIM